jgi:hypothetical protein
MGATTEQKLEACRAFESVVTSERQRAASNPDSNNVSLLKQVLELMPKSMEPELQQKVDELKRSLNPKPPRNEAVNGFVNEGGHVMSVPVPPAPLANALDKLTGKIKISGGGEHPVIKEMRDSLAAGTQPVVLLQKLEKMYNSSSVKYNPENKQAVREAAKEIYDGAIHGKPIQSTEQLRVVDALVGLGFEGIDAMRLSYDQDPVKL